ncbi:hypothetical protein A5671_03690 [Mycolicibacter heraklionensis]|nr:hypothetical protein A5671_03690 [Mycolicibacter heraklionensis]
MELTAAQRDRACGTLLATAAGDALGAGYEFDPSRGPDEPVGMIGGDLGPFQPGEWTDDTSMAIAIAEVAATGADLESQAALDAVVARWHEWSKTAKDVGVQRLPHRVDQPHIKVLRTCRQIVVADPAQRHHRVHFGGQFAQRSEPADPYLVVMRMTPPAGGPPGNHGRCSRTRQAQVCGRRSPGPRSPTRIRPREYFAPITSAWHWRLRLRGGGDTDTVAAIAGGLLGAVYGASAVPSRWRLLLSGWPGLRTRGLIQLADAIIDKGPNPSRTSSCPVNTA